jgi:hypothetical protein
MITGYSSNNTRFERVVPGGLSDGEIKQMLARLACLHLTEDEIISASLRKNMRGRRTDLEVQNAGGNKSHGFMIGDSDHYTARYVRSE